MTNGPTACEDLATTAIVFEAEVLDVDLRPGVGFQWVEFQILRSFKGEKSGRWSAAFSYGSNDHMFAQGTHVLVYAIERKGKRVESLGDEIQSVSSAIQSHQTSRSSAIAPVNR